MAPPFMRSRMKQSLSGVWKAYVMQTMNGQSEICYQEREVDRKRRRWCSWSLPYTRSYLPVDVDIWLPRSMSSDWRTWGLWLWWCPSCPVIVWMITMLMVKPTMNDNTSDSDWWRSLPCPVETRLSMILSLRASVSPCFILIRFLSRHCKFLSLIVVAGWWRKELCHESLKIYFHY